MNRQHFLGQEMIEATHIVKHVDASCTDEDARLAMQDANSELENGQPFSDVVARYSDCKEKNGDVGRFSRGVMVEEFENVVFGLKKGERSEIFRTPLGYHIAEVRERIAPAPAEYDEVKEHILKTLRFGSRQKAFELAVAALRKRAQIAYISRTEAEKLTSEGAA